MKIVSSESDENGHVRRQCRKSKRMEQAAVNETAYDIHVPIIRVATADAAAAARKKTLKMNGLATASTLTLAMQ